MVFDVTGSDPHIAHKTLVSSQVVTLHLYPPRSNRMSPSNGHSNGTSAPGSFPLIYPENREFTGGDLLAQTLKHLGVSVAFGIHGGHLDAFLTGCDVAGIRLVDSRHEQASVNAAEGYAKVTGKVGVCFATANSG